MQAIQAQAQTSGELAAKFGRSERHIRRTIADLILEKKVIRNRDGRDFLYSLAAAAVEDDNNTTTITGSAETADNHGHNVRDRDLGHPSNTGETISDIRGHDCGHGKPETSKQRYRNRRKDPVGAGHPNNGLQIIEGFEDRPRDSRTGIYDDELVRFERDSIQFVLLDRKFRDLVLERSRKGDWEVRENRGKTEIHIPSCHLRLHVARDTVIFYSHEPGDMSSIAEWARSTFADSYDNIASLVSRIKNPESLSNEELCVIIRDPQLMSSIRASIAKDAKNGVYTLQIPNDTRPGLKIYERDGTMRIEFIITTLAHAVSALSMRVNLMNNLPRMHKIPGLFWEFVQFYYSALHHPIIIDTGGHEFLQALSQMSGQFTDIINKIADKIPKAARTPEEDNLCDLKIAIEDLESGELGDIIRVFRDMLNVEETPTKVFLAAWTVWMKRNFKGRVIKADIASLLLRANDPISASDIAAAIVRLKKVQLLQEDERLEICFSPEGAEMARILMAKREGM